MPRSKNRRIAEMLAIIRNDRTLRRQFLELFAFTLMTDYGFTKDRIIDFISSELADRVRWET